MIMDIELVKGQIVRQMLKSRRAAAVSVESFGMSLFGALKGADLGGSSKKFKKF